MQSDRFAREIAAILMLSDAARSWRLMRKTLGAPSALSHFPLSPFSGTLFLSLDHRDFARVNMRADKSQGRQGMFTVNRAVAIIKPKQPYLDWIRGLPDPTDISLDQLRQDCTAVLLPDIKHDAEAIGYLQRICQELFDAELAAWDTTIDDWPSDRGYTMFRSWFDIEIHSLVLDSSNAPIQRETFSAI